ncbi:MAG TPA: SpoIIE family protein phosphatase [Capillimicrobium sp.]
MSADGGQLADGLEELFDDAPCGYVAARPDGAILRANRTLAAWVGTEPGALAGRRFQDLLAGGGRIYYETHVAPLLQMQGSVSEIALDLARADGSRLPALVNAVLRRDGDGRPVALRVVVFAAEDRRRYEQELLRARQHEQQVSRRLQTSLLAGDLVGSDALDLDVAYRPAERGLQVGGDWYDAFWIEDGASVGLVVGDVVGRGIEAAATMGQLRSAVRALAASGHGPAALLEALDAYARRHAVGRMTTLVYAELRLAERELRYACAGHPPPALARPGERPTLLWEGRSLPLDTFAPRARSEAAMTLPAGATIVLYTDGLIERPSRPLAAGLEQLLDEVAAHGERPARALVANVVARLGAGEHADDMCVLAARVA